MSKRLVSLIAALLAVIMLIPSVALAEDPSITITTKDNKPITVKLYGSPEQYVDLSNAEYEFNLETKGDNLAWIKWTSADESAVGVWNNSDLGYPTVWINKPCKEVKITGELFRRLDDGSEVTTNKTASFLVTGELVKETKITPDKATVEISVGGGYNLRDWLNIQVTADDGAVPTYGRDDLIWSVDNEAIASVTNWGNVAGNAVGTATVTAVARGNSSVKGVYTVKVIDTKQPEEEDRERTPITKVAFTSSKITLQVDDEADPDWYVLWPQITPEDNDDRLRWDSTDPQYVKYQWVDLYDWREVSEELYNDDDYYWDLYEDGIVIDRERRIEGEDPDGNPIYSYWFNWYDGQEMWLKAIKPTESPVTIKAFSEVSGKEVGSIQVTVVEDKEDTKYFKKLAISPSERTLYLEDTNEFNLLTDVVPYPAAYAVEDSYIWESSDEGIATVNNGLVKLKKAGTVTITVSSKNNDACEKGTCTITIKEGKPEYYEDVAFKPTSKTLYLEDYATTTFDASALLKTKPVDPEDDYLIWTSSDKTVARVSKTGAVKLVAPGKVTITARSAKVPDKTADLEIEIKEEADNPFTDLKFTKTAFTVKMQEDEWKWVEFEDKKVDVPEDAKQEAKDLESALEDGEDEKQPKGRYEVTIAPANIFDAWAYLVTTPYAEDVTGDALIWTSSDDTVAVVNPWGQVWLQKPGKATITVRSLVNNKTASLELTVEKPVELITKLGFTETKVTVKTSAIVFQPWKYLVVTPLSAADDEVIFTSSNPQIAALTDLDDVVLLNAGTVEITARSAYNPKCEPAKITLEIVDDSQPIKTLSFIQSEFSLDSNKRDFSLYDYVVIDPVEDYTDYLVWTSSDPGVVEVDEDGCIYLNQQRPGTATITVRSKRNPAATASVTVTHTKAPLTSISFIKEVPTELRKSDESIDLTQYLVTEPWYYATIYASDLQWSSDSPQYAGVTDGTADVPAGTVYYRQPGKTVTISVCDKAGKVKPATIKLTTTDVWVTDITFANGDLEMKVGDFLSLDNVNVLLTPADADYSYIEWSTSDPDIVDLEFDDYSFFPRLIAKGVGTAKITAHVENAYNQVSKSFKVTVSEHTVSSVKFAKSKYTKKISRDSSSSDNYVALYFTVKPYDMTVEEVEKVLDIQSSDRSIVDVLNVPIEYNESKNMYFVVAKCLKPGTAKVTITNTKDDKVLAKTKVIVKGIAVKKVKMPKKTMKLFFYDQGETRRLLQNYYQIKPVITPSNAWYNVTWETTNPGVAFVEHDLEKDEIWVVATGAGSATITMNVDDGTAVRQAKMKVIVNAQTVDLKMSKKKATITMIKGKDNTLQLEAINKVTDEPIEVKWKSSNKKVATVDKNGLVTAKKAGTAVITATTKDGNETSVTCNLTVEKKEVTSLKAKSSLALVKKDTKQLKVKVKPTDAYDTSLSFKSSDESVVTVDSKGLVTAVGVGEATIKVTTKDGTKLSIEIAVTVTKK